MSKSFSAPFGYLLAMSALLMGWPSAAIAQPGELPLVNVNEDHEQWLRQADDLLEQGETAEAVRAYQALLVNTPDGRIQVSPGRFISVAAVAEQRLGDLPEEAMRFYRSYYDPQAEALYNQAVAEGDRTLLARVISEYFHTSFGDKAQDLLATLQFDQGRFSEAALGWQRLLRRNSPGTVRPEVVLAKAAVAWHFAGVESVRDMRLAELAEQYADASAELGGAERNILDYARQLCRMSRPGWASASAAPEAGDWPSFAGAPDSLATMTPSRVVLAPQWRSGEDELESRPEVQDLLRGPQMMASNNRDMQLTFRTDEGAILYEINQGNQDSGSILLPPLTHPVVSGELLLLRRFEHMVACDLLTGKVRWLVPDARMTRPDKNQQRGYYPPFSASMPGDLGRYTLTVADDMGFFVGKFDPGSIANMGGWGMNPAAGGGAEGGSQLYAFRVSWEGYLEWVLGLGVGDDELTQNGTYLCAPTYSNGRLYATMRYMESYYLACLDPHDGGRLVWKALIGQSPPLTGNFSNILEPLLERGSPPAVGNGVAVVCTNAGLIAAFRVDDGTNLWTVQYESDIDANVRVHHRVQQQSPFADPPNPLIITRDRVIIMPADSDTVLALNLEDGVEHWRQNAANSPRLSAVSAGRVLLTGQDLLLIDTADGELTWQRQGVGAFGRPAVMDDAFLVSTRGQLLHFSLEGDGAALQESIALTDRDGVLGNLVSVDGKLVAANAGVACVYMGYQQAYDLLTQRLDQAADPAARMAARLERGRMARNIGRYDQAVEDLQAVIEAAGEAEAIDLVAQAEMLLQAVYIEQGDDATDLDDAARLYALATDLAAGSAGQGEMLIRIMRLHERSNRLAEAVAAAQQLSEAYGEIELRDVPIGPEAPSLRRQQDLPAETGYAIGQRHVARMIEVYGPDVYEPFDQAAREAMAAALEAGDRDALLTARQRYPHSRWADDMLLKAAEMIYNAVVVEGAADDDLLFEADALLAQIQSEYPNSPEQLNAVVGQALIQLYRYPPNAYTFYAGRFAAGDTSVRVAFGDFEGTVGELVAMIAASRHQRSRVVDQAPPELALPLSLRYQVSNTTLLLLRDADDRPITLDRHAFIMQDNALLCLDVRADKFAEGIVWRAQTAIPPGRLIDDATMPSHRRLIGHLHDQGRRLAVVDRQSLTVVNTRTGAVLRSRSFGEMGLRNITMIEAEGNRVLLGDGETGQIHCIDLVRCQIAWSTQPFEDARGGATFDVAGNLLVQRAGPARAVRAYQMAAEGRMVYEDQAPRRAEAKATGEGMLVAVHQSYVRLVNPSRGAQDPVAEFHDRGRRTVLLGLDRRFVVIGETGEQADVTILNLQNSLEPIARLELTDPQGGRLNAHRAVIADGTAYLLCGGPVGEMLDYTRGYTAISNLHIAAVELSSGRLLWGPRPVSPELRQQQPMLDPVVTDSHLIFVRSTNLAAAAENWPDAYLVDRRDGSLTATLPMDRLSEQLETSPNRQRVRQRLLGVPAVVDNTLILEDRSGIAVYQGAR